jgi:hypothetical protein
VEHALALLGLDYDPGTGDFGVGDPDYFGCEWKRKLKRKRYNA